MRDQLKQRADYTHKFNKLQGRHSWLRLTPAYSAKIVAELIEGNVGVTSVLDPFCGTGTTALCATEFGHHAVTIDINPFLVWLAQCKTATYRESEVVEAEEVGRDALRFVADGGSRPIKEPPIRDIDRWWPTEARRFLTCLRGALLDYQTDRTPVGDLLHVAFCRTLSRLSNAAFNHQSMSFRDSRHTQLAFEEDFAQMYMDDLRTVLRSAIDNPRGTTSVLHGDSRRLASLVEADFDLVVTSPPYANRMSYIRELRPYMYWMGYLTNGRDAGELDWQAIGGTWGVATSRLLAWAPAQEYGLPLRISEKLQAIAQQDNRNGVLLSNYVAKYIEDMADHFSTLRSVLRPGARIHYVVGNSTFYGILVPTEQVYASLLVDLGFSNVVVRAIRKRNSKKELLEFIVSATWPG